MLAQPFPYSTSWKVQFVIALAAGTLVAFVLVFLQPFDTYATALPYKTWKLIGYGGLIPIAYLPLCGLGYATQLRQRSSWQVYQEALFQVSFVVSVLVLAFLYHHFMFSGSQYSIAGWWGFSRTFSLPFLPLLVPLLVYLRYRTGSLGLTEKPVPVPTVILHNQTQTDRVAFEAHRGLLAEARQNYVIIVFLDEANQVQKHQLRLTLTQVAQQWPQAQRIHRSFLVNLAYAESIQGNQRKSYLRLAHYPDPLPVSQQHYSAIKEHLHNSP